MTPLHPSIDLHRLPIVNQTGFMLFLELPRTGVTRRIVVTTKDYLEVLGIVKWQSGWRRYVFHPEPDTFYDEICHEDLRNFLHGLMFERKAMRGKIQ